MDGRVIFELGYDMEVYGFYETLLLNRQEKCACSEKIIQRCLVWDGSRSRCSGSPLKLAVPELGGVAAR